MSQLQRATLLLDRNRPAEAEAELRGYLAREPDHARAHSFLALALAYQGRHDEAESSAREGVHLNPADDYTLQVLSNVLQYQGRNAEALAVLDDAIRINPENPVRHHSRALILYVEDRNAEALEAIDMALSLDPEDADYLVVRARILNALHRNKEARETAESALRLEPNKAAAYEQMGWASLWLSQINPACESFREALRLDPENEGARSGIVEALKARFPVYRGILAFLLWMQTLSPRARWGVILGLYFGARILRTVGSNSPELRPVAYSVLALYVIFVFLTWTASPLCNLFLRLHPIGRHALTDDERTASNLIGALLLLCIAMALGGFVLGLPQLYPAAGGGVLFMIPLSGLFRNRSGSLRRKMAVVVGLIGLLGAASLVGLFLNPPFYGTVLPYLLGCFFYSIIHNILANR